MPNAKAIGTPITTHSATSATKKMIRLTLPSVANTGRASHMPAITRPSTATAETTCRAFDRSASRTSAISIINTAPTPIAATRTESCSSSAGVVISHWFSMYSHDGERTSSTNTITISALTVSTHARHCGRSALTKVVSRMCSPRRSAITAPSMASHRNSTDASSSDQVSGLLKT